MKKASQILIITVIGVAIILADVWLLGPVAAIFAAAYKWLAGGLHGHPNYASAWWYFHHPLAAARAWLGGHLSQPEVRSWWIGLNGLIAATVLLSRLVRKLSLAQYFEGLLSALKFNSGKKRSENRDIISLHMNPLKFSLKKHLDRSRRKEIFLGLDDRRRPVTIPMVKLKEHIHILGGSGTGKTSLAVLPICIQAIRQGLPVICIDFKGDEQAVKLLAREARAAGKKFHFFTLHPRLATSTYNPLASGSVISKVERVMIALELIFEGEAKFYSYVQQSFFIPLLQRLEDEKVAYTLKDIQQLLESPRLLETLTGKEVNENQLKGLTAALTPYGEWKQINNPSPDIDLGEVMQRGEVCYFDLRSAITPTVSSALGKMIAMDLQAQAVYRNEGDPITVIAIDEFQNMACDAFRNIVAKVRSAGYGLVLANQALGDLAAVSRDFANVITTNTATKIVFNVEDPADAEYFARRSGHVLLEVSSESTSRSQAAWLNVWNGKHLTQGESHSQVETYHIHPNVFLKLPFGKSVIFRRGQVATLTNHAHLLTLAEKKMLEQEPWPTPPDLHSPSTKTVSDFVEELKADLIQSKASKPAPARPDAARLIEVEEIKL
ncbi:type IV secretion system DNA-binding domain-containing protein [Moorella naiadis]|uniref:type IV secretory system conjugative DNA transfer family protein n=1 Tax=Moorella naiadis (nom. illeg.) TaxID=3093670 RepID=UPI003D9CB31E